MRPIILFMCSMLPVRQGNRTMNSPPGEKDATTPSAFGGHPSKGGNCEPPLQGRGIEPAKIWWK
jgi:hypothetical protein